MKDVQNILEVLDGVDLLLVNAKGAFKDKKIDLTDIQYLINVSNNFEIIQKAIDNLGEIPKEIKDIDGEEGKVILLKLFEVITKLK